MSLTAEPILQLHAALGEGALWDPRQQVLYWVNILGKKVYQYTPATGINREWPVPADVGTVVVRRSGGLMLALGTAFASLDLTTGHTQPLADPEADSPGNRMNDGKCDPAGRFWAGTMPYGKNPGGGTLWRLDVDHSVHKMLPGVTISNGLTWSADAKTMYYIDTPTRQVAAFDYDLDTGNITRRRVVVEVPPGFGSLDGMTIDAEGKLWIAVWGAGMVGRWDPATGKLLEQITVPGAKQSSSCAFGGPNLDHLYITSAAAGTNPEDQPNAGALFVVKLKHTRGVPAFEYLG